MLDPDVPLAEIRPDEFRALMVAAADALDVVEPVALRKPLRTWFLAAEEMCRACGWVSLVGRPVASLVLAARALLNEEVRS